MRTSSTDLFADPKSLHAISKVSNACCKVALGGRKSQGLMSLQESVLLIDDEQTMVLLWHCSDLVE